MRAWTLFTIVGVLATSFSVTCQRAYAQTQTISNDQIYRQIEGIDREQILMTAAEISEELNDLWATSVLRENIFPDSVAEIVDAINRKNPDLGQASFVVGEGSQIPLAKASRTADRDLRYVISWPNPSTLNNAIHLSAAPGGHSGFFQVIAWDSNKEAFNYYELQTERWTWTGDTSHARNPKTIGQGCFDCHLNGTMLMKELKKPWNNWSSSSALISASVVPVDVADETLFKNKTDAAVLQAIVQSAILVVSSNKVRDSVPMESVPRKEDGLRIVNGVPELLRHLTLNTTVNFESSQSLSASDDAQMKPLPLSFFVNDFVLRTVLGIAYTANPLKFKRQHYEDILEKYHFELAQNRAYTVEGSTNFAFFVPVPSAFDGTIIQTMLKSNIITPKFAASILMVDFSNPVFSSKREKLNMYAEQVSTGKITNGMSNIPNLFATKVKAVASQHPACDSSQLEACTPEQQFLHFWNLPDEKWQSEARMRLDKYLAAVDTKIQTAEGADAYMRLSISQRQQFTKWPLVDNLNEFTLLLPRTNLQLTNPLEMKPDGTVGPQ